MNTFAEVVIRQPGFPDRVVPLREGRLRLGRADDNEIVLSDVGVSRRHALIVFERGDLAIEDTGSGNGTYFLGHKIKSQPIRDRDEVVIDPFVLLFRVSNGPDTVPMTGPDTVVAETDGPRLEVVVGNGVSGSVYPIADTGLTMGRAEDRDVVVPDPASSRHHCHISLENGEYVLHDNGSANGVFVNAVRVRECTLSDGDLVRIGNTELRFVNPSHVDEPEPPRAVAPPAAPARADSARESWDPQEEPEQAAESEVEEEPSEVSEPEPQPEPDRRPAPRTQDRANRAPEPAAGGPPTGVIAAGVGVVVTGVLALTALAVVVAIAFAMLGPTAGVNEIPARPPAWALNLPPDLPQAEASRLQEEGQAAAGRGEYGKALENFYRVLLANPAHDLAKTFAAYSAMVITSTTLERELTARETVRIDGERRRDKLLRLSRDSANNRTKRDAKRELEQDFREDPLVREEMSWSMTPAQQDARDIVDRITKHVQTDQHAEAIRLGRRLLETSREAEVRDRVNELLVTAEAHQARALAPIWRNAVFAESQGDSATALKLYKEIIVANPNNPSAQARIARLSRTP